MSEPKRYDLYLEHRFQAEEGGEWVKWEDYARLKAEVERLTKAGEWQPIETAPKDGGTILTYRKGNVFVLNQYYGNSSYEMTHWIPLPSAPAKEVQS